MRTFLKTKKRIKKKTVARLIWKTDQVLVMFEVLTETAEKMVRDYQLKW